MLISDRISVTGKLPTPHAFCQVTDSDGSEDVVYHFVKGTRTYEAAKEFFGCADEDWHGLPLMSWPPHGRDSHHETRVMRDDVMSYGDGDAVSAITLATFEERKWLRNSGFQPVSATFRARNRGHRPLSGAVQPPGRLRTTTVNST